MLAVVVLFDEIRIHLCESIGNLFACGCFISVFKSLAWNFLGAGDLTMEGVGMSGADVAGKTVKDEAN